ncbi:ferritin-like domain-containing protein [Pseudarthrobacter phenanthrenivorans]|uniref:ferritin-like domain-containing protein n=1 Tax=Pseudarthrobacter phenanthrenivorans TaxID=361575 RepID=UPI00217EFFF2|nr:ferritin-like domain-containing protein [Pseudarthrobacter phenanthrenivorans]
MKDDNQENRPLLRYFRYAVISFTAFLVLGLGFTLIPADPPAPADPPFSEQARRAALADSLDLLAAARQTSVAAGADTAASPAADATVTLLTLQARALVSPSESSLPDAATAPASSLSSPSAASEGTAPAPEPTTAATPADLAAALSASGLQRLRDAETADGGMARLLAGAGTAQLLAAGKLAAASGVALETLPHAAAAAPGGSTAVGSPASTPGRTPSDCPSPQPVPTGLPATGSPAPAAAPATDGDAPASARPAVPALQASALGSALAAAGAAEHQGVYAYQAALPRLAPDQTLIAQGFLEQHQELASEAAAHARAACLEPAIQQPGYVLDPGFLAAPATGLAALELAALPVYGDLVAHADGEVRKWAIAALQSTARRAVQWGGDPGPVPGIALDPEQLPGLSAAPTASPAPKVAPGGF